MKFVLIVICGFSVVAEMYGLATMAGLFALDMIFAGIKVQFPKEINVIDKR